ncbi:MAG: helix-turn-helix domain-containing protein [Lachnospiraceae bacterium]|nr:helix-turn-helix domain-containing protein [Lachnospiraceae bacterium]
MKINAPLLFHELQRFFQVEYVEMGSKAFAKTPMFYNIFFECDEHIVLLKSDQLSDCLSRVKRAIIICVDPAEQIPPVGENDLIVLNDPMADSMAFNVLNHILDKFQEWEIAMNDVLYHSRSFQDMVDLTGEMVGLPIALHDSEFHYIAYSKDSDIYMADYVTQNNDLPEETIQALQTRSDLVAVEELKEAFVERALELAVCRNMFNDGVYVGRLTMIIRSEQEDIEFFKAMFDLAVPFMESLYAECNSFSNVSLEYQKVHDFLELIFDRRPADRRGFLDLMHSLGAREGDLWRVASFMPKQKKRSLYNRSFISSNIEQTMPGAYCVVVDGQIIVLMNESLYRRSVSPAFTPSISKMLGNFSFYMGISRPFSNVNTFENVYFALRQATYTLSRIPADSKESIHMFDRYALDYLIMYGARETNYEQICHPALITLHDHDVRHNTSFTLTIKTYLACNMNAVLAAKTLYIHRSSFINRMERLQKLVALDLTDPEERLYLNLSFRIFHNELLI